MREHAYKPNESTTKTQQCYKIIEILTIRPGRPGGKSIVLLRALVRVIVINVLAIEIVIILLVLLYLPTTLLMVQHYSRKMETTLRKVT